MKDLSQLLIENVDIGIPSGGSIDGGLMARWRQLLQVCDSDIAYGLLAVEPGDFARIGSDEVPRMALSLPVAVDVWYLFHCIVVAYYYNTTIKSNNNRLLREELPMFKEETINATEAVQSILDISVVTVAQ